MTYLVHVNDGSNYGDYPHKDDVDHVLEGRNRYHGKDDGTSDKGAFFKFESKADAESFAWHVNKCPKRSCYADILEGGE